MGDTGRVVMDGPRMVRANGVDLCVQAFGDPADPAILLMGGATQSMDWWDDALCTRLAAAARYVIRYDPRDTGASTTYPAGLPPYTGDDLAADAVALLDAFAVPSAHIVALSMSGILAQRLAIRHPTRVATLTLASTTPDAAPAPGSASPAAGDPPDAARHPAATEPTGPAEPARPADGVIPSSAEAPADAGDASVEAGEGAARASGAGGRAAAIAGIVAAYLPSSGPRGAGPERLRAIAGRVADRTRNLAAASGNHLAAGEGTPVGDRLAEIAAPTLVVHGTADPMFPYDHAEALAAAIPGARLLPLDGVGHEVPPPSAWDTFVPAVLRHTSGGWPRQADRLARKALAAGDPTGWFDRLYEAAAADEVATPWDRADPQPLLAEWARERGLDGTGRTALVVGCGLGADAEFLARLGFATTAFDISEHAVAQARARNPGSPVRYVTADLLNPPAAWLRAYDLVVEVHTVQALPDPPRARAIAGVGRLVGPGGTALAIAYRDPDGTAGHLPPWPLTRAELDAYTTDGLTTVDVHHTRDRWRAEFTRPG